MGTAHWEREGGVKLADQTLGEDSVRERETEIVRGMRGRQRENEWRLW